MSGRTWDQTVAALDMLVGGSGYLRFHWLLDWIEDHPQESQ